MSEATEYIRKYIKWVESDGDEEPPHSYPKLTQMLDQAIFRLPSCILRIRIHIERYQRGFIKKRHRIAKPN